MLESVLAVDCVAGVPNGEAVVAGDADEPKLNEDGAVVVGGNGEANAGVVGVAPNAGAAVEPKAAVVDPNPEGLDVADPNTGVEVVEPNAGVVEGAGEDPNEAVPNPDVGAPNGEVAVPPNPEVVEPKVEVPVEGEDAEVRST